MEDNNNSIQTNAETETLAEEQVVEVEATIVEGDTAVLAPKKRKSRKLKYQDRYAIAGFLFALPFIIGFAVFKLAPLIVSFQLSFSQWTSGAVSKSMQWVGWYNYIYLFTESSGRLVNACVSYVTSTLLQLPVINISAFFFAILLNRKMPGQSTFRAIFFIPVLIGTGYAYDTLSTYMSQGLSLSIPGGLLYYLGGSEMVEYITTFFHTFVTTLWKTGVQVLLFLTGLQGISKTLYESAYCDGATEWEQFWKITLPMMTPTILLCLVYTIIIRFNDTDNPFASYYFITQSTTESTVTQGPLSGPELATVSWVYALISIIFVAIVFLIMNPIIKRNSGRD